MSDMQISTGTMMRISEAARDNIAAGIWFAVLAGSLFLTAHGQSILMTAGLMLELTAAYSTFVLCGKGARSLFVHAVQTVNKNQKKRFVDKIESKLGRPIRTIKARAQELHIVLPGEDKNTKRWVG